MLPAGLCQTQAVLSWGTTWCDSGSALGQWSWGCLVGQLCLCSRPRPSSCASHCPCGRVWRASPGPPPRPFAASALCYGDIRMVHEPTLTQAQQLPAPRLAGPCIAPRLHGCILKPRLRCPLLSHPCHRSASVESCPSHGLWSLPPSCPCPVPARSGCCAPHPSFVIKLTLRKPHI